MNALPVQYFYPGHYSSYNPYTNNYGPSKFSQEEETTNDIMAITRTANCTADSSVYWIYEIFGQCVLSNVEMFGFVCGMLSIACWMMSTIPQLVINCRVGSADKALSFYVCGRVD